MADSHRLDRSAQAEGREHDRQAGLAGEELGDSQSGNGEGQQVHLRQGQGESGGASRSDFQRQTLAYDHSPHSGHGEQRGSGNNASDASSKELGDTECIGRPTAHRDSAGMGSEECQKEGSESESGTASQAVDSADDGMRQTQPPLGRDADGPAGGMDYAELCVTCDNRTDELRLLGNGVVPATAELAFRTLHASLADDP